MLLLVDLIPYENVDSYRGLLAMWVVFLILAFLIGIGLFTYDFEEVASTVGGIVLLVVALVLIIPVVHYCKLCEKCVDFRNTDEAELNQCVVDKFYCSDVKNGVVYCVGDDGKVTSYDISRYESVYITNEGESFVATVSLDNGVFYRDVSWLYLTQEDYNNVIEGNYL